MTDKPDLSPAGLAALVKLAAHWPLATPEGDRLPDDYFTRFAAANEYMLAASRAVPALVAEVEKLRAEACVGSPCHWTGEGTVHDPSCPRYAMRPRETGAARDAAEARTLRAERECERLREGLRLVRPNNTTHSTLCTCKVCRACAHIDALLAPAPAPPEKP